MIVLLLVYVLVFWPYLTIDSTETDKKCKESTQVPQLGIRA